MKRAFVLRHWFHLCDTCVPLKKAIQKFAEFSARYSHDCLFGAILKRLLVLQSIRIWSQLRLAQMPTRANIIRVGCRVRGKTAELVDNPNQTPLPSEKKEEEFGVMLLE